MDYKIAHEHSKNHRDEILNSDLCGCFYCLKTFTPDWIMNWTDEGQTALCPKCAIDAVIGSAGVPCLKPDYLYQMRQYWFGED